MTKHNELIVVQVGRFANADNERCYQLYRYDSTTGAYHLAGGVNDPRNLADARQRLTERIVGPLPAKAQKELDDYLAKFEADKLAEIEVDPHDSCGPGCQVYDAKRGGPSSPGPREVTLKELRAEHKKKIGGQFVTDYSHEVNGTEEGGTDAT
jgi:hypothetical protein